MRAALPYLGLANVILFDPLFSVTGYSLSI